MQIEEAKSSMMKRRKFYEEKHKTAFLKYVANYLSSITNVNS